MVTEKRRILAEEIARVLETPRLGDDEITTRRYAEFAGCPMRRAYTLLIQAVIDGKMTKRKVLVDRNRCWAFTLVEDNHPGDAV